MNCSADSSAIPQSFGSRTTMEQELYFLIAKFLSIGPCRRTYEALQADLDQHKVRQSLARFGLPHGFRNFCQKELIGLDKNTSEVTKNLVETNRHISPDYLLKICQRIIPVLNRELKPSVEGVMSLLGAGRQSILRTEEDVKHIHWSSHTHVALRHNRPLLPPPNLSHAPNILNILSARQQSGFARQDHIVPHCVYTRMTQLCRSLGHLSAVYCVSYDRTGSYIFTGADDHLVKVWSARNGRLLCTMRGHAAEITDITCNTSNTLIAAGSCDKLIRIWCLQTSKPVAVLHGHSNMITSVRFCPYVRGSSQYLVSTGGDGCLCLWEFNPTTKVFNTKPLKFIERSRAGTQMLCSSFSPGGVFLATGSSDSVIRVYSFIGAAPHKICELEAHNDRIDSIQYASHDSRFVSASKDGTARIWRFERQEWKAIVLDVSIQRLARNGSSIGHQENRSMKYRVTMVCWSNDDQFVITAVNDFTIKVWNSHSGELIHILQGHKDELFVLEQHPIDRRIVLSAGHDGNITIWDIVVGCSIKTFYNSIAGQGHGAVFDCRWAPDGQSFVATDSHGYVMQYGFGSSDKSKMPEEMFFHTDYRPLIRDANNYVLDEQTQLPPHLMPPAFLVDIDGNPHPARFQRLVPGRENCDDGQLVPMVVITPSGEREVLDISSGDIEVPEQVPVEHAADVAVEDRPILDEMILRMQREHDQRAGVADSDSQPGTSRSSSRREGEHSGSRRNRSGSSRSVDVVRQLSSFEGQSLISNRDPSQAAPTNMSVWMHRKLVHEMDRYVAETTDGRRHEMAADEIQLFLEERKKKLLSAEADSDSSGYMRTRRREKRVRRNQRSTANEETGRNRLLARALYDTDTEEHSPYVGATDAGTEPVSNASLAPQQDISPEIPAELDVDGESTEYSDWVPDEIKEELPKRRSQRQVKRRRFSSPESSSSSTDEEDTEGTEDEDHTDEDVKQKRNTREKQKEKAVVSKKKQPVPVQKNVKETKRKLQRQRLDSGTIRELAPECRPPEWLTDVMPRKTPYIPQIGDEVIYFLQGHREYVKAVQEKKIYNIDMDRYQPWNKIPHIREQELMKVSMVKYEIRAPRGLRLVCLKLLFIDPDNGKPTGNSITIRYHDVSGVVDFIILRQTYNIAMSREWNVGDRFRCVIDNSWWMGTVTTLEPFQEEYQDSMFQCLGVLWDNGESEKLSPWDLEPLDERRIPGKIGASMSLTVNEIVSMRYNPKPSEWSRAGQDAECERIIAGLEQIMGLRIAESFAVPVDLNAFPIYALIIAYPVDLSTVKARLENRFYRRLASLEYDIQQIETNAREFNDSRAAITEHAHIVTELCLQFIRDSDCTDPMPLYAKLTKGRNIFVGPSNGHEEDDSETESEVASPTNTPTKRKMKVRSGQRRGHLKSKDWRNAAETLLCMMIAHADSQPFRQPVETRSFPDYLKIVRSPMDFGTMKEKLESGAYSKVTEFCNDVRLVFKNSRLYNTNKRSRIYAMTLRLSSLFEDRVKKILQDCKESPSCKGKQRDRNTQSYAKVVSSTERVTRRAASPIRRTAFQFRDSHPNVERIASNSLPNARINKETAKALPARRAVKRVRRFGSDTEDEEQTSKRSRTSNRSTVAVRRQVVQRSADTRRHGSRTGRWLSDSDDEETSLNGSNHRLDAAEEEDESDEEFTLSRRRPPPKKTVTKKKPDKQPKPEAARSKVSNGHASTSERYSTRCVTGVIKRKQYDKIFIDEDDVNDNVERVRRASRPRNAKPETDSDDAETVSQAASTEANDLGLQMSCQTDDETELSGTESEATSVASESTIEEKSCSQSTDSYSDDEPPVKKVLKMKAAVVPKANGRKFRCRGNLKDDVDDGRKYGTRNRGRRTVLYNEDSDGGDDRGRKSLVGRSSGTSRRY